MRIKLHEQLEDLTNQLALMCHLAGEAIESATGALVHADLPLDGTGLISSKHLDADRNKYCIFRMPHLPPDNRANTGSRRARIRPHPNVSVP